MSKPTCTCGHTVDEHRYRVCRACACANYTDNMSIVGPETPLQQWLQHPEIVAEAKHGFADLDAGRYRTETVLPPLVNACTCPDMLIPSPLCIVHGDPRDNSLSHDAPVGPSEPAQRPQTPEVVSDTVRALEGLLSMVGYLELQGLMGYESRLEFTRLMAETALCIERLKGRD